MKLDSMMRELRALVLLVRARKRPHVRGCGLFTAACAFAAPARPLAPFPEQQIRASSAPDGNGHDVWMPCAPMLCQLYVLDVAHSSKSAESFLPARQTAHLGATLTVAGSELSTADLVMLALSPATGPSQFGRALRASILQL
jgi:hypothetical protein